MMQILGCHKQTVDSQEFCSQKNLTKENQNLESLNFTYQKLKLKVDFLNKDLLNLQKKYTKAKEKLINTLKSTDIDITSLKIQDLQFLLQLPSDHQLAEDFIQALESFTYERTSERIFSTHKLRGSIEKHPITDFIDICIECKIKAELLTTSNEELYSISNIIDKVKSKICDMEQQISTFSGDLKDPNDDKGLWGSILKIAQQKEEESAKLGLNSEDLYGQLQDAGESSTIIFDDSEVCCNKCFWII